MEGQVGGERVQAIDGCENAGSDGDGGPLEAIGISGPIPLLMMGAHDGDDGIWETYLLEDLRAYDGMRFHLREFGGVQLSRFRDDGFGDG